MFGMHEAHRIGRVKMIARTIIDGTTMVSGMAISGTTMIGPRRAIIDEESTVMRPRSQKESTAAVEILVILVGLK